MKYIESIKKPSRVEKIYTIGTHEVRAMYDSDGKLEGIDMKIIVNASTAENPHLYLDVDAAIFLRQVLELL